jgi:hypothetical protein
MRSLRVLDGDCVRSCRLDGFGPVPGMAGQERPELETAGVLPVTQVNGTSGLMAQIHDV